MGRRTARCDHLGVTEADALALPYQPSARKSVATIEIVSGPPHSGGMTRRDETELSVARLAARQHGIVTLRQARESGMSSDQVFHRARRGRLVRVHRGTYRHPGAPETWRQRAMAACLGAPDGAVLSHLWAAALHGLIDEPASTPDVTVRRGQSPRLDGVAVHLARQPFEADRCVVDGIPCTNVARTLIDCAKVMRPSQLRRLTDTALQRKLVTPQQIAVAWDHARRAPGRHGERKLRKVVNRWAGAIDAGSAAEVRLRRQIRDWGFPEPTCQVRIRDGTEVVARVDLAWPDRRIAIEYDSDEFHGPNRWDHDESRQARIEALGWTVLRADKEDLRPGARAFRHQLEAAWRTAEGQAGWAAG